MKHTIHVTVTLSVEVDDDVLKAEYGRKGKKIALEHAIQTATLADAFDSKAVIVESYEGIIKAKRGIGSY